MTKKKKKKNKVEFLLSAVCLPEEKNEKSDHEGIKQRVPSRRSPSVEKHGKGGCCDLG